MGDDAANRPARPGRGLARAIDDIVASYRDHGNINHLDGGNLPSRSEIARLLDDLVSILFPGFFVDDQVDDLTCRYFVGERCARVLRGLERAIERALVIGSPSHDVPPVREASERTRIAHARALELINSIPRLRAILDLDVQAAMVGDPAARSASEVIMAYPGVEAIAVHRIAHQLHSLGVPLIPRMMAELVHSRTGIDIHPGATIGEQFFIDHGTGVVIGETTTIGRRVKIYQGVTLGALSVSDVHHLEPGRKRHPTLEDDVTIYAGATILGGDTVIGEKAVIGGNVWITHSVPARTTVLLENPSLRYVNPAESAK